MNTPLGANSRRSIINLDNNRIFLFKKPACPQCTATERKLKLLLADRYDELVTAIRMDEDPAALEFVKESLGYQSAPVVYFRGQHWYGYRPDDLVTITKQIMQQVPQAA